MPEEIIYETEDGTRLNELLYRRTVRGIPSPPITFYARNLSTTHTYDGRLFVGPGEGPSYSQDLYIGDEYEVWDRFINVTISPGERALCRTRVVPRSTPSGQPGRARIFADSGAGVWKIL